ncbi:hypothetical protein GLP14_07960 [Photobacterium carnosum]|uniref:hypothetical protein n=1 Tax=Photobacterium carnosum TaxID=2023717 RepID=UPI001E35E8B1|nr:hypothetical protein [Photobacterium carnosum]MCD9522773.1 hypothetical protein [Photobacterium carnosum]
MSNFLFCKKNQRINIPSKVDIINSFSDITDNSIKYFENENFILCFDESSSVKYHTNGSDVFLIFGSAIYNDKLIDNDCLSDVISSLNDKSDFDKLSGRFVLIHFSDSSAKIIDSIFSSFPHYSAFENSIHSSSLYMLNKLFCFGLNINAVSERILFFSNYGKTIINDVVRVEPASIFSFSKSIDSASYLNGLIKPIKNLDLSVAADLISSRMEKLLSKYFQGNKKASLSFTGGRDSRLLLCQLMKIMDKDNIKLFTVGKSSDIEYSVGKKFSDIHKVEHLLFTPTGLNGLNLDKYSKMIGNINFPCQYKDQYIDYLKEFKPIMVNTAIPETVLCHLAYFEGNAHPALNFVKNRSSNFDKSNVLNGENIEANVFNEAQISWDKLSENLPNETITKIFFELTTFQRDWVYNILRASDYSGATVCVMEDPEILSILSSVDESYLSTDILYETIISRHYSFLYDAPTTRQLASNNFLSLKLSMIVKNFDTILKSFFDVSSLGYLTEKNQDFIKANLKENHEKLLITFDADFLERLFVRLDSSKYTKNRLINLYKRKIIKNGYISDYDLLIPLCVASLLNNY